MSEHSSEVAPLPISEPSFPDKIPKWRSEALSEQETEILKDQVIELLKPQQGEALRTLIKREMFNEATDSTTRDAEVVKRGYDPNGLRALGQKTIKKGLSILEFNQNPDYAMDGTIKTSEYSTLPQLVFSERKNNSPMRHSDLTVGASLELSRQMRKILAISIENDSKKFGEAAFAPDADITDKSVNDFITLLHGSPKTVSERQQEFLKILDDESKRQQYSFAKAMLNRNSVKKEY